MKGTDKGKTSEPRTLQFEIASVVGNERVVMDRIVEFVTALDLPPSRIESLKTAVSEAALNAIEHGNQSRPELVVSVEARISKDSLSIRITDSGANGEIPEVRTPDLEAKLEGREDARGWGLFLIKNMVDRMEVSGDRDGHTIELILDLHKDTD